MSKFLTLLVEDDDFQREVLAHVLRDEGFEEIECTTAESAELIVASLGTELQALGDHHQRGAQFRPLVRSAIAPISAAQQQIMHSRRWDLLVEAASAGTWQRG